MIKPFRDKREKVTRAFSFNGGLGNNHTLKWVILGPFPGQRWAELIILSNGGGGDVTMTLRGKVDARRTSLCPRNCIPPEKANARGCVFTNLPFLFYRVNLRGGGNKCTTCDPIWLFIPPPLRTGVNPSTHATIPHGHPDINNSLHTDKSALTY